MLHKLNLHCHTTFSDGNNTLEENIIAYKEFGFSSAIITDHFYPHYYDSPFSLNLEKYKLQLKEAKHLSNKYSIPIIVGIELGLRKEEILIFNEEVIINLFKTFCDKKKKDKISLTIKILEYLLSFKEFFASILCHPTLFDIENNQKFFYRLFSLIDGYEHFNRGHNCFSDIRPDLPAKLTTLTGFCNSDAHFANDLEFSFNLYNGNSIKSSEDLISWIKTIKNKDLVLKCKEKEFML